MRDHVRFQSIEFSPRDAEPGQLNTNRYGYLLATWLAARLKERGFDTGVPTPEDWGWLLGITSDGQYVDLHGKPGEYQEHHQVYDREGEDCRRCRAKIVRIKANQRSTFFCEQCQV